MKTYDQLSASNQAKAKEAALLKILTGIAEGHISFSRNDPVNEKIQAAIAKADQMQTPWFSSAYILDTCRDELALIAEIDAKRAFYREPGDLVLMIK